MKETCKRNVRVPVNVAEFNLKKTTLLEGYQISSIRVIGYIDALGHKRMLKDSVFMQRPENAMASNSIIKIKEYFMSHGKTFYVDAQLSLRIEWETGLVSVNDDWNASAPIKKINVRVTGYKYQKSDEASDSKEPLDIDALGLSTYLEAITHNRYKDCFGYVKAQEILNRLNKKQTVTLQEYTYLIDSISSMAKEDMFMYPENVPYWNMALEYFDDHILNQMRLRLYDYDELCRRVHEVMDEQKTDSSNNLKALSGVLAKSTTKDLK